MYKKKQGCCFKVFILSSSQLTNQFTELAHWTRFAIALAANHT